MTCSICNTDLVDGHATLTLEPGATTVVVKDVPALVCPNCGEEHVSEEIAARALRAAERAAVSGSEVAVLHYQAA
jgi:YgiT-type zinc finger domain-containing protein